MTPQQPVNAFATRRPGAGQPCAAPARSHPTAPQAPSALEQAQAIDLQTFWPTHRIRSFLSAHPR